VILGLDPSLTGFGWAVVDGDRRVLDCGVISTKPQHKKRGIRVMDSQCQRSDVILSVLDSVRQKHPGEIRCVVAEGPAGSKSVKAACALERAAATWQTWAYMHEMPRVMVTSGDIKRITSHAAATKEDVETAVWDWVAELDTYHVPPSKREHVFDAIGAVIAAWDSDVVRMARQSR
jgi:Holliday junction resolvasome RuvABC endonuclease subunit